MANKYEVSFTISVQGENPEDLFTGVFKVKTRLSHRDSLTRDQVRRSLLGPNPDGASPRAESTADVFSELAVRIVDAPSWWVGADNGMALMDDAPVSEVYKRTMESVAEALEATKKKGETAKTDLQQG